MVSSVTQNALEFCPASLNVSGITVFGLKIRIFTFLNFLKHSCAPQQFTAASLKNFQGCIVVYLSRFQETVYSLCGNMLRTFLVDSFESPLHLSDSLFRISYAFRFVNNFFKLFFVACRSLFSHFVYLSNESEYITLISLCQHLFFIFFEHFEQFVFQLF